MAEQTSISVRSVVCLLLAAAHFNCKRQSAPEALETQPITNQTIPSPPSVQTIAAADAEIQPAAHDVRPGTSGQLVPTMATDAGNLIRVPSGSVRIKGSAVAVDAFAIDRTEVTVGAYARCVAEKRCSYPAQDDDACNWAKRKAKTDHPVNCVTVKQAQKYCEWKGQRLPTVAEWQFAAGGAEGRRFPWGAANPSNTWVTEIAIGQEYAPGPARHNLCWIGDGTAANETYPTGTCKVGSFPAGNTPSGIADLAGNVWEWTGNPQRQPHGTIRYSLKGGGYDYDPLGRLEVAVEDEVLHDDEHYASDVGFRCISPSSTSKR